MELLREVIQLMRDEPKRVNMDVVTAPGPSLCGTQGCILGWLKIQLNPETNRFIDMSSVQDHFPPSVRSDLESLFFDRGPHLSGWPTMTRGTRQYAEDVVAHIEKFIAAHQRELVNHRISPARWRP